MNPTRRQFVGGAAAGAAFAAGSSPVASSGKAPITWRGPAANPGLPERDYRPTVTLNGSTLPFKVVDGTKVFHLIAEPVEHAFADGLVSNCWGYNGSVHGPTLEAVEGDHVRIYVTNKLPAPTTTHWHGLYVPSGMDGVGGLTQRAIEPGETFLYEFTLRQHGCFMYHSHHDEMVQMAMGLMGMFIIHPREPVGLPVDRDYVYLLSEWSIRPGARRPDPNEMMDFNVLTMNGRIFPGTTPMVAAMNERIRIRIGNLSAMDHHPIHIHGTSFEVVATDGGEIPLEGRWRETSILVPTGSTRTIELIADNPGDWAVHCHMTHHTMTQMGHNLPNLVGVDPSAFDAALERNVPQFAELTEAAMESDLEDPDPSMPKNSLPMMGGIGPHGYITMGGMFTLLKIREKIQEGQEVDWYQPPPGTQAERARAGDLQRDGIDT